MTIVAAWMSAETGVGPAIASGSQTYRGICADLPVAPMKRRTATEVMPPAKIMRHANGSVAIEPIVLSALVTSLPPPTIAAVLSKKLIEG